MFTGGMMRTAACAVVLAAATTAALGWGDDFNDDWLDPAIWGYLATGNGMLVEANQRLEYFASPGTPNESSATCVLHYQPVFENDWTATVNAHLSLPPVLPPPPPWYCGVGLSVGNPADPTDYCWFGRSSFDPEGQNWTVVIATNGVRTVYNKPASVADGQLRLTWNSDMGYLSAYCNEGSGWQLVKRFFTDEWGMGAGSAFTLGAGGISAGYDVPPGGALALDNFTLEPGPETLWQAGEGDWYEVANWSNGVPRPAVDARIENGGAVQLASGEGWAGGVFLDNGSSMVLADAYLGSTALRVGLTSSATFTHRRGRVETAALELGVAAGASGVYDLIDGNCVPMELHVGRGGQGRFVQTGGRLEADRLDVGTLPGASGLYELADGNCVVMEMYVGCGGNGILTQTGGHAEIGMLSVGEEPGSVGTYQLGGAGRLSVPWGAITLGRHGTGTLEQTGGTVQAETLNFGTEDSWEYPGGTGSYQLRGGELRLNTGIQMSDGNGTLLVEGGQLISTQEPPDPEGPAPEVMFHFMGSRGNFTLEGRDARIQLGEPGMQFEMMGANRFTQLGGTVLAPSGMRIYGSREEDPEGSIIEYRPRYTIADGELRIGGRPEWGESDLWIGDYGEFVQTGGDVKIAAGHLRLLPEMEGATARCTIAGGQLTVSCGVPDPSMPREKRGGMILIGQGDPWGWSGGGDANAEMVIGGTVRAGCLVVGPIAGEPDMPRPPSVLRMAGGRLLLQGEWRYEEQYDSWERGRIGGRIEGYGTISTGGGDLLFLDGAALIPSGGILTIDGWMSSAWWNGDWLEDEDSLTLPLNIPAGAGLRASANLSGPVNNAGLLAAYRFDLRITGDLVNTGTLANEPFGILIVSPTSLDHRGSIEVNGPFGMSFDLPITNHAGQSITLYGGTLAAPLITNAPGGTMTGTGDITAELVNQGTTDFFGAVRLFGALDNRPGGHFGLRNGNVLITGPTVNEGTIKVLNGQAYFEGGYDDHGVGDLDIDPALVVVHGPMRVGVGGTVTLDAASNLQLLGDFSNESTRRQAFDLDEGTVQFHGQGSQHFEVAGRDLGLDAAGWADNFAIGRLIVETGSRMVLTDAFDNSQDGPSNEALYVGELVIAPGAWIDLAGSKLYYRNGGDAKLLHYGDFDLDGCVSRGDLLAMKEYFGRPAGCGWCEGDTNGDGAVDVRDYLYLKTNYGWASAEMEIPEPATVGLLAAGAAMLLLRRRRE